MPELPEVQTIVSDLKNKILNKKIIKVDIFLKKIIKNKTSIFCNELVDGRIVDIQRKGKLIIMKLSTGKYLLIHLRMTGQLILQAKNKLLAAGGHSQNSLLVNLPNKYTHVIVRFKDFSLFYNDLRRFGFLQIVDIKKKEELLSKMGMDAMDVDFDLEYFEKIIKNKKNNIKQFLLNQKYISGLGNIYVDEILFASGVNPSRTMDKIKKEEIILIFKNIKKILSQAIKYRGTTFNNYRDAEGRRGDFVSRLRVYGRERKKCFICGDIIKKSRVAQRGTSYCPTCQRV